MRRDDPGWTTLGFEGRPQPLRAHYDLVVIGGGYTGLSAAWYAARRGLSVCVLDRGDLSEAASGRNAGFCTVNPPVALGDLRPEGDAAVRRWYRWFEAAVDHCEALIDALGPAAAREIGFARVGNVRLAQTARQAEALRRQGEALEALGIDRHFLTPDALDVPAKSTFSGGLFDWRSARLNPGALHMSLARACQDAGVDIYTRTSARDVGIGGAWAWIDSDVGRLKARHVLVATNGFAATTIPRFRQALLAVGSFLIRTHPIPAGAELGALASGRCHATSFRFPHYFRLTATRELLFGGRASLSTEAEIDACADWLLARARDLLPGINLPEVAACWGGRLGFSVDKRPLMGHLDRHLVYAMGCAGHGVPTSLAMGREVVVRMLGERPDLPAPFWRDEDAPPPAIPALLRLGLPLVQSSLRMLDRTDRLRDIGRSHTRHSMERTQ